MNEQTHYGVTEMAEILHITKQAMSARMNTKLFKEMCTIERTRHGRMVAIDQFDAYSQEWKFRNAA